VRGKGCTPAVVRAILACGVAATCTVYYPGVGTQRCASIRALAAFAASEALEAVRQCRTAEACRAAAEGWISIALELFEADSPFDAPRSVAVWGQKKSPRSASAGGGALFAQAALYGGGPASMRREPPCATLCVAEALVAWSTEKPGRAPLAGASDLISLVAREMPMLLTACPGCGAALAARRPPAPASDAIPAEIFPSLHPFPTPRSSAALLKPWDLTSIADMRVLEDFLSPDAILSRSEQDYLVETRHTYHAGFFALRNILMQMFNAAVKAGGASLPWQSTSGTDNCIPARDCTAPLHKGWQISACRSAQKSVFLRLCAYCALQRVPLRFSLLGVCVQLSMRGRWSRGCGPAVVDCIISACCHLYCLQSAAFMTSAPTVRVCSSASSRLMRLLLGASLQRLSQRRVPLCGAAAGRYASRCCQCSTRRPQPALCSGSPDGRVHF